MNIDSESTEMQIVSPSEDIDISSEETNKIDMSIKPQILSIQVENKNGFSVGTPEVETNKNHARLKNLDYENSGHTGFASSKDIESINNELLNKANKDEIPDTSQFVQDENYVHTDNNFTDEDKEKLDNLEGMSGNAVDISYEDNMVWDVHNVQEALDLTFETLDNTLLKEPFYETVGNIDDLNTPDTSNLVNAINSIPTGGIKDLGYIDMNEWDWDYDAFMGTLVETGEYIWHDDDFEWYTKVTVLGSSIGQEYWGQEESYLNHYKRSGWFNDETGEYEWEDWIWFNLSDMSNFISNKGIIDLGFIDFQNVYGGEYNNFYNNLTQTGEYKFVDDTPFEYYFKVTQLGNQIGQQYWCQEEGYNVQYIRSGYTANGWKYEWEDWQCIYLPDIGIGGSPGGSGRIDLGEIDLGNDWDGDMLSFLNTLTETGEYTFIDEYGLTFYVQVNVVGNIIGQFYWGDEEGYKIQNFREGRIYDDEIEWFDSFNYLFRDDARDLFAFKTHYHHTWLTVDNVRDYLDNLYVDNNTEHLEFHLTCNDTKYIVKTNYVGTSGYRYNYQEYYDIRQPEKIYKRSGYRVYNATGKLTWDPWYVFEGTPVE